MAWLRSTGGPHMPLASSFWTLLLLGLIKVVAKPQLSTDETVRTIVSISLVASGILHAAWFHNAATGALLLDAVLIAIGIALSGPRLRIFHCR